MEGRITHGPENAVRWRASSGRTDDHGVVRRLRSVSQDGVQVDRTLSAPGRGRSRGALAPTAPLAKRDGRGDRDGDPRGAAPASVSGVARNSWRCCSGAIHGGSSPGALPRGHPEPPRPGADPTPPPAARASGQADKARSSRPTTSGVPTTRASSGPGDGRYCYPLTVTDGFSRYLLGCQALNSTAGVEAKPVFTRLFQGVRPAHADPHGQRRALCDHPPWRVSRNSRRGGSAWASCRNSSSRGGPTRTGGMNGCIAR